MGASTLAVCLTDEGMPLPPGDNVDGSIEQGFSGRSILWPYALLDDERPPPRDKLYLRKCNATDSWQQWNVSSLGSGNRSMIANVASGECLSSETPQNPMQTTANASACTGFSFNPNRTISAWSSAPIVPYGAPWSLGRCMDAQFGEGPVVQLTSCKHPPTSHVRAIVVCSILSLLPSR